MPSTPGMDRKAAINSRAPVRRSSGRHRTIKPDAKSGAHHHGHLESIIYVVRGKARMRWGEHLEFTAEAGPGDFISRRPMCRIRKSTPLLDDEALECPLRRSDGEAIAINPPIELVEKPRICAGVDLDPPRT